MEIYNEAFVYKWTNLISGAFYIGYHKGSQDDGYICSSKSDKFWDDFRNPIFTLKREILFEGNAADCVKEEYKILNELNLHDEFVYNNSKGGGIVFNDEVRKKMAKRKLGKKRPHITEETRKRMSDAKMGKTYSLEARANMSAGMKGRIPWNVGISFTKEVKQKMSISAQNRTKKHLEFFKYCKDNYSNILNEQHLIILDLYLAGVTNAEICKHLNIADYKIKNTLRSIKTLITKNKQNALSY